MSSGERRVAPTAVVLGLSPTGLYAVREFGRAGVPVVGIAETCQAGAASRYLQDCLIDGDDDRRLEWLTRLPHAGSQRPVLVPTPDQEIEFVSRNATRLSGRFVVFQDSYANGQAALLMTKQRFYDLCSAWGIDYPRFWSCTSDTIRSLRRELRFPCIVKPSRIHDAKAVMAGKKGWVVENFDAFDALVGHLPPQVGVLLIQEIVPGPESNITLFAAYFDGAGNVRQGVTGRKLRQYPPGFGSASRVVTSEEPETREAAIELLRRMDYRGIAAAEFKRDPRDGRLKIIEVNARPSLWFEISHAAGKRLCLAAYHDLAATGQKLSDEKQTDGVQWVFSAKDLYSRGFYRLHRHFILPPPTVNAWPVRFKQVRAVYAPDDPRPLLGELINYAVKAAARARSWLSKIGRTGS